MGVRVSLEDWCEEWTEGCQDQLLSWYLCLVITDQGHVVDIFLSSIYLTILFIIYNMFLWLLFIDYIVLSPFLVIFFIHSLSLHELLAQLRLDKWAKVEMTQ